MIYCVINKTTKFVLQMGLHDYAVKVEDPTMQEMVRIDIDKPTDLSEIYFKVIDGRLVKMNEREKAESDAREKTKDNINRVNALKQTILLDPVEVKKALGL